ncbi:DNA helicase Pif1 like protein, partial [Rhizophagus irregularis DAOM 181602=DAOM 197198]
MQAVNDKYGHFFIDGFAGTGKTFLYNTLLATIRLHGDIAIAVASSGIAALLLSGGRTAHS